MNLALNQKHVTLLPGIPAAAAAAAHAAGWLGVHDRNETPQRSTDCGPALERPPLTGDCQRYVPGGQKQVHVRYYLRVFRKKWGTCDPCDR